jgi:hypothetical protein
MVLSPFYCRDVTELSFRPEQRGEPESILRTWIPALQHSCIHIRKLLAQQRLSIAGMTIQRILSDSQHTFRGSADAAGILADQQTEAVMLQFVRPGNPVALAPEGVGDEGRHAARHVAFDKELVLAALAPLLVEQRGRLPASGEGTGFQRLEKDAGTLCAWRHSGSPFLSCVNNSLAGLSFRPKQRVEPESINRSDGFPLARE